MLVKMGEVHIIDKQEVNLRFVRLRHMVGFDQAHHLDVFAYRPESEV